VTEAINPNNSVATNLLKAYEALLEVDIVTAPEISLLKLWLQDLDNLT
jgi:hypothetical protein